MAAGDGLPDAGGVGGGDGGSVVSWRLFAGLHVALAGVWLGAMVYSLVVVQPRVVRFFPEPRQREEFLITLAHGNRRPVLGLIAVLMVGVVAVLLTAPTPVRIGYAAVLALHAGAAGVFWWVSWRHWPARVFALPEELPGYQRRLRRLAWSMLMLVGAAFGVGLTVSLRG